MPIIEFCITIWKCHSGRIFLKFKKNAENKKDFSEMTIPFTFAKFKKITRRFQSQADYSYLNESTGFAAATLSTCEPTVSAAIKKTAKAASTNGVTLKPTW